MASRRPVRRPKAGKKGSAKERGRPASDTGTRAPSRHARSEDEERLRRFAELSQEGLFIHEEGIIHDVNPAAARMVGYGPEELIGKHVFALVAPESIELAKAQMIAKPDRPYELRLQRCDGTGFWAELHGRTLMWQGARLRVVSVRDITSRRRAEEALRESEEQFRQLAENIKEVFFVRDLRRGKMVYVSPAYEDIWRRPREALLDNPMDFIAHVHPEDRERVLGALRCQEEGRYFNDEYRIVRPDGDLRWIRARAFPIRDEAGEVCRLAGIAEDITERKHAEIERRQHEKTQRDALVREVHHRIKNNLQGIVGLLQNNLGRYPELRETMETTVSQIRSIAMVHGLQGMHAHGALLLSEVVPAIVNAVSESRDSPPNITLVMDFDRSLRLAVQEAVPVALILNELVFNATKHRSTTASAEPIILSLRGTAGGVCIAVLSPGTLPTEFDFDAGVGLGAGLGLVKALLPQRSARLTITDSGRGVRAELTLSEPAIDFGPAAEWE